MNDVFLVKVLHGLTDLICEVPDVLLAEIFPASPLIFEHTVQVALFRIFHNDVNSIFLDERIVVPIV